MPGMDGIELLPSNEAGGERRRYGRPCQAEWTT